MRNSIGSNAWVPGTWLKKKNRIGEGSEDRLEPPADAARPGRAGIGRRTIWLDRAFLVRSASKLSSPRMPDDYRNLRPPGRSYEDRLKTVRKKTPLLQPTREDQRAQMLLPTPAPASALSCCARSLPPACCSRGQVKSYFANSSPKIATGSPSVNPLYPAEIAQRPRRHVSAGRGPLGGHCVAMTQSG
jgi:hypothetical protein